MQYLTRTIAGWGLKLLLSSLAIVLLLLAAGRLQVATRQLAFISNRDGNDKVYILDVDHLLEYKLSDLRVSGCCLSWSPDGETLALVSDGSGGNSDIYLIDPLGHNLRKLTDAKRQDGGPVWSPDGKQIAFVSNRDGNFEIYRMNANGSDQQRVLSTDWPDYSPVWSPDGETLALMTIEALYYPAIYRVPMDCRQECDTQKIVMDRTSKDALRWLPDGRLAFSIVQAYPYNLYAIDPQPPYRTERLTEQGMKSPLIGWSSDSDRVAYFTADPVGPSATGIYVMNMVTGVTEQWGTIPDGYGLGYPSLSASGRELVFDFSVGQGQELYLAASSGEVRRLTFNPATDYAPAWRPGRVE